jgi:hypothetical protein
VGLLEDLLRSYSLMRGSLASLPLLDKLERSFWLDVVMRAPVLDAIEEEGVEVRRYGPILVTAVPGLSQTPLFSNVLGAAEPGAVEGGHLAQALEWIESLGVDFRVPVTSGREEAGAAEDLLNQRGYRRSGCLVRFIRSTAPPDFPELPGVEVLEVDEFTEGFSDFPGRALGLDLMADTFFDGLPQREDWRCYVALDEEERPIASASMMVHWEVGLLGFAGTMPADRGRGAHLALLRQRIIDAEAAHCHTLCAETEERPDDPDSPSSAARNLVWAGFKQAAVRPIWRPPPP